ncbi:unnamed protein product [Blepharisma stoltei]|uniref:Uncharacterized protein n=1 Tax=Blepharisma stoltei TaxID=1481888 RepID=A0AAU9I6F9_9CILI|nr:unnamed protein product [Blepharisma stoltei]
MAEKILIRHYIEFCIIAKEQFFLLHLACPKNLETPKLSGNGGLGSFCQNFFLADQEWLLSGLFLVN